MSSSIATVKCPEYWNAKHTQGSHLLGHAHIDVFEFSSGQRSRHKLLFTCKATEIHTIGENHVLTISIPHDSLHKVCYSPSGWYAIVADNIDDVLLFCVVPDTPFVFYKLYEAMTVTYELIGIEIKSVTDSAIVHVKRGTVGRAAVTNSILKKPCSCVKGLDDDVFEDVPAEEKSKGGELCLNCNAAVPDVLCVTCRGAALCNTCSNDIHSAKMFQRSKHDIVPYDAVTCRFYLCQHHRMRYQLYCVTCELPLCVGCNVVEGHKGHEVVSLEAALPTLRRALIREQGHMDNNMRMVAKALVGVKETLVQMDATTTDVVNDIAQHFAKLRADLDRREKYLLSVAQEKCVAYGIHLNQTFRELTELNDLTKTYQEVLMRGDDMDTVVAKCVVMSQILRIPSVLPPPPVRVSLKFNIPASQQVEPGTYGSIEIGTVGTAYEARGIPLQPLSMKGGNIDEGGVVYYLGTSGRRYTFRNPTSLGLVKITSSAGIQCGRLEGLTSRCAHDMWTHDSPGQWIEVDLLTSRLEITHYSLQHGGKDGHLALRHWMLEGYSEKSRDWVTLRHHVDDKTLFGAYCVGTWSIPKSADADCLAPPVFQKFRIRLTGPNQAIVPRPQHYVQLCGIEFYGTLYL